MRRKRIKCSIDIHLNLDGDSMSCIRMKDRDADPANTPENNVVIIPFPEINAIAYDPEKQFVSAAEALNKGFSPPVRLPQFYSESAKNTIADCYHGFRSNMEGQDWEH